jgi:NAD(P)H dehydrogenase (quinone)
MSQFLSTVFIIQLLWASNGSAEEGAQILVAYYSEKGHTQAMAEAVAAGARSVSGVRVKLLPVAEATTGEVLAADAIILGSPVYNANAAPAVLEFIKQWPFEGALLRDKIGAAFVTGGGISAGEELTQMNILHAMLVFGMIVVGGPDWQQPFGASGIVAEAPFETEKQAGAVDARFLAKGKALGKRVAELARKLRGK